PRVIDDDWERDHAAFHRALVSGCQSHLLLRFREAVHAQGDRYRHLYLQFAVDRRDHLGEHRRIMAAALGRDAEETVRLVREHLRRTVEELLARGFLQGAEDGEGTTSADDERSVSGKERDNGRKNGSDGKAGGTA
ncbi:MAG: FCD domain-containing protein, partial [Alphaproteobacteria bacterium]